MFLELKIIVDEINYDYETLLGSPNKRNTKKAVAIFFKI